MQTFIVIAAVFSGVYAIIGNIWVYHQLAKAGIPLRLSDGRLGCLYLKCREHPETPKSIRQAALSTDITGILAIIIAIVAIGMS